MADETTEKVLDVDVEQSFNDALADLKKAMGEDDTNLEKAKTPPKKPKVFDKEPEDEEEAKEEDEEDEDEDEREKVGKSVEDLLSEDPEAEASMDVEPFLRQLAKAIDGRMEDVQKSIESKMGVIETLTKAQGKMMLTQAELTKSQAETVKQIAKQDVKVQSIRRLSKARFEGGDTPLEVDGPVILEKSQEWLQKKKIDLLEAGMIETRINKGLLGKQDDRLDRKVKSLLKEAG